MNDLERSNTKQDRHHVDYRKVLTHMQISKRRPGLRVYVAAVAVIAMAGVLGACSGSSSESEAVTLYVFGPNNTQKLAADADPETQQKVQKEVIDGFLAENKNVKEVIWDAEGDRQNSTQRLITGNLSEQPMDLIACDANGTNSSYVRNGVLKPFDAKFIDTIADRIEPAALHDYVIDGEQYGIPISAVSVTTMFYNADLLASLNLEPPTTYDELLAMKPALDEAGVAPVEFQGANTGLWSIWYTEALAQTQEDPVAKAEDNIFGRAKFTDASDFEAFALIRQWIDDGVMSKDVLGLDAQGMLADFAAGKVAMIFDGTFRIAQIQNAVTDFTWGASPFPEMPGAEFGPGHGGGPDRGMCLSAKIAEDKIPVAESFLEYLTRQDVAQKYLAPLSPIESSVEGVDVAQDVWAKELRDNVYPDRVKYLDWVWPAEVTGAINASLQGIVSGEMTPEQAASDVQQALDDLVAAGKWPPTK